MGFPDFNVTRLPFNECAPNTVDGIRALARIAVEVYEDIGVMDYLDGLELLILQAMRVKPDGVGTDWHNKVVPIGLKHTRRGIVITWRVHNADGCEACAGRGTLKATGHNGQRYSVECPECCGSGETEGDEEFLKTDLDGHEWQRAA